MVNLSFFSILLLEKRTILSQKPHSVFLWPLTCNCQGECTYHAMIVNVPIKILIICMFCTRRVIRSYYFMNYIEIVWCGNDMGNKTFHRNVYSMETIYLILIWSQNVIGTITRHLLGTARSFYRRIYHWISVWILVKIRTREILYPNPGHIARLLINAMISLPGSRS